MRVMQNITRSSTRMLRGLSTYLRSLRGSKTVSMTGKKWVVAASALTAAAVGTANVFTAEDKAIDPHRPKLVILGSGWGALSVLQGLSKRTIQEFDICIVSPRNYFVFSPLLPCVTVGTVEARSIVEPIRRFCHGGKIQFLSATALKIDNKTNTILCRAHDRDVTLNYDHLVVAVGAETQTFGIKGVEDHCLFLKDVDDARKLRDLVYTRFEQASVPGVSDEEKKRLLSFVVVGGGPTGVEFAGELYDHMHEDLHRLHPDLCSKFAKITVIQSGEHILNTFDRHISEYTEQRFARCNIHVQTGARVVEVDDKAVHVKTAQGNESIPFGVCLWAAGIRHKAVIKDFAQQLGDAQKHKNGLVTDCHLRVLGTSNVYAVGDCASVAQPKLLEHCRELLEQADTDENGNLSAPAFTKVFHKSAKVYPQILEYGKRISDMFQESDTDKDGLMTPDEFAALLEKVDKKLRSLPATAQVASQQGKYIAEMFNNMAEGSNNDGLMPFKYKHFGSFAYIGSENAVIDSPQGTLTGWGTFWLWRGAYTMKQVTWRTRTLVMVDFMRSWAFGRDTSRC